MPAAYLGRIFNMILLPKRENKTGFCLVTPLQKLWGPGLTLQLSFSSLNGKPERTKTPPVGQPTSSSWKWSWYTVPRDSFYSVSAIVNSSGFTLNYPSLWNNITTGNICTGSVKIKTSYFKRDLSHILVLWQLNVELPKDWIWQIWMQIQTRRESWKGFLVLGLSERYLIKSRGVEIQDTLVQFTMKLLATVQIFIFSSARENHSVTMQKVLSFRDFDYTQSWQSLFKIKPVRLIFKGWFQFQMHQFQLIKWPLHFWREYPEFLL